MEIKGLAEAISDALEEYNEKVIMVTKKSVDETAKEVNMEIKNHCTFGGNGEYIKAFALKTIFDNKYGKGRTWHVKAPYYRLTHLLEKGHLDRSGVGRARAFPHIKYGEKYAIANLPQKIREKLK